MGAEVRVWKIYVPSDIFTARSGDLHGIIKWQSGAVVIHKVEKSGSSARPSSSLSSKVGTWTSKEDIDKQITFIQTKSRNTVNHKNSLWVDVGVSSTGTVLCEVYRVQNRERLKCKCHCILYSPRDLLSSYILTDKSYSNLASYHGNQLCVSQDNITDVVSTLLTFSERTKTEITREDEKESKYEVSSSGLFYYFCRLMLQPFLTFFLFLGKLFDNRCTQTKFAQKCLDSPALSRHIRSRCRHLRKSLSKGNTSPLDRLRFLDSCARQLLDSTLGMAVVVVMVNATLADTAATNIMDWADNVASSLTHLINWMMGAPAGLKLNSQLTHSLGHFFLYHIYLWTGYLSLLHPAMGVLLRCSSLLGVLGLSAQLCLAQDVISMMTVHIYCFYVYAARLYSLQVYALASLWRLFRGKKWNVLRHRVDSAVYDIDQLFVGTLMFTILLFLLPTTLLYYVFFLGLRLVVLVSEGILGFVVRLINRLPVYTLTMWIVGSNSVSGDVLFSVVPESHTKDTLVLSMQMTHLPLHELLKVIRLDPNPAAHQDSLGTLVYKMIQGKLIYPWIDDSENKDKKNV